MKKSRHDDSLSRSLIDKQQTVGHQNSVEDALSDIHLTNANKVFRAVLFLCLKHLIQKKL